MYLTMNRFRIKPGQEDAFEAIWKSRDSQLPQVPGFVAFNLMRGKWRNNQHVEVHEAERVVLKLKSKSKKFSCVIDGELGKLEQTTVIQIHKKALNVWLPKAAKTA